MKKLIILFLVIFFASIISATIINVPGDQPTIQAGINVAVDGDTVLVAPGTYYENIEIYQKNDIHIIGSGVDVTTIDGDENGHVVVFNVASGSICNFTITNSGNDPGYSCGVFTSQSRVIIENNIIAFNNRGISISSSSDVFIYRNKIVFNAGYMAINFSASDGVVSYNLITDNTYHGIYHYYSAPDIFNNTIVGNNEHFALLLNPLEHQVVHNNILVDFEIGILLQGGAQSAVPLVDIAYNDVWNNSTANYWEEYGYLPNIYSQPFTPQPGTGEIHDDPLFVDPLYDDYHLQFDSPCIDAGDPNSPFDPDETITDIGAFYYHQNNEVNEYILNYSNANLNNFPNPFNPTTTIRYQLPDNGAVNLSVYNIKGQKIKTIVNEKLEQGLHQITWDGKNDKNQYVASGVYFYKLKVNEKNIAIKKCLLLK